MFEIQKRAEIHVSKSHLDRNMSKVIGARKRKKEKEEEKVKKRRKVNEK
jgi:hypothetical protein